MSRASRFLSLFERCSPDQVGDSGLPAVGSRQLESLHEAYARISKQATVMPSMMVPASLTPPPPSKPMPSMGGGGVPAITSHQENANQASQQLSAMSTKPKGLLPDADSLINQALPTPAVFGQGMLGKGIGGVSSPIHGEKMANLAHVLVEMLS